MQNWNRNLKIYKNSYLESLDTTIGIKIDISILCSIRIRIRIGITCSAGIVIGIGITDYGKPWIWNQNRDQHYWNRNWDQIQGHQNHLHLWTLCQNTNVEILKHWYWKLSYHNSSYQTVDIENASFLSISNLLLSNSKSDEPQTQPHLTFSNP